MTVNRDEVTQTRIRTTTFATTNHHGHRSTPPPAANQRGDSSHFTVKPHSGRRSHRHQPGSETYGLVMLLVRACGTETFVPWTLLERAGVQRLNVLATLRFIYPYEENAGCVD
ncbi:unnamed protein product [Brassica rapa]|uniref:Uncharacterized protein n=1 Tax=Brassica campestris TaxID=3711 RepID=A0A8D9GS83_BRACM|nr:unnamed protein product [Brassica rapa]